MEDTIKPTSNISEIVSRFAKVCKFRSIGVFTETPDQDIYNNDVSNDVKECVVEMCSSTINSSSNIWSGHDEILKVFEILSELKMAYVELQKAHIPYDSEKIRSADDFVVANLDGLCKVRRAFKENQFKYSKSLSSCLTVLRGEIKVQERLLERLKGQAKKKDVEISCLKGELYDLESKNRLLVEEIKCRKKEAIKLVNLSCVDNVFKEVQKGIHDFAKPLIALMKASNWDLDEAANSIQDSVVYSVRSHKKYAFEAYISRRMFDGFALKKSKNVDEVLRFNDPVDVLIDDPNGNFAKFCRTKYLMIVHPTIEFSFFGNLDQRNFVSNGKHPMTPFYELFVKMARWVWLLQGIAGSQVESEMFVVSQGSEFCDSYMENIEGRKDDMGQNERYKVELMVMPGFIIGDKLLKSRIYVSKLKTTS